MMKKYSIFLVVLILVICSGCTNREIETEEVKTGEKSDVQTGYDIEKVFPDPLFSEIMEGKIIPVEFRHGFGGEAGYFQYPSKDSEVIKKYIEALKEFRIEKIIEDKDQFVNVCDAVNDYIFILNDGRETLISIDLNAYAIDMDKGIQYVLEYNETLNKLNRENDIYVEDEPLKKFSFSSEKDIGNLSGEDVIYLVTHDYNTSDFIEDFREDPYNDFGTPLDDFERFEPYMLNPGGERKDYDVNKKISDQDFKKLAEEHMNSLKGYDDIDIVYFGETDNYIQYGLSSSQQFGFTRRCFYRNVFMLSDTIEGTPYAGPYYLGELTIDNVLSEEDFKMSNFEDTCLLWRAVEDKATAIVYSYYCPDLKNIGDYDECDQNQKAQIIKYEISYDKDTHRITSEAKIVHSVDIPDTKLYINEPV